VGNGDREIHRALLSALHVLALGIGLGSVFMRGRYLRALRAGPQPRVIQALFAADSLWGIAALLWLASGLARASGHVEKAPEFYLRALEIWPMMTFIRCSSSSFRSSPRRWRAASGSTEFANCPAGGRRRTLAH
jgi:uncharacterized membrane protein